MAKETMTFDKALVALKEGKSLSRECWIENENRTIKFKKGIVAKPKAAKEDEEPKPLPESINGIKIANFEVSESSEVGTKLPTIAMTTSLSQSEIDWSPSLSDVLGDDYFIK